ncbi:MAG TPA: NAD(P)-dependent oxidoreductase [Polyangiaceae bacterium]|nr:NAD(P)-dependent oxidoreductase [Polyangiaceae bacterium]
MATLAGKTLFITGASRGIGLAIALRAAKDGANVTVAAKTADPHPKLPGTVYTACEEIEKAGGKALACITDIRFEDQVAEAVKRTVDTFGGIDILVNNASAISLTRTPETPMKRFDLMHQINARGTYVCTQACYPHLKKAKNPHVLTLSPPLNLEPRWFGPHVAYSLAKYGMSLCALGHAEEFKPDGIAVNTLWPRTVIATAAVQNLLGGDETMSRARKPEIMADAAYAILTKPSREFTGRFCIDDEVLRDAGVTNLDAYSCVPGSELLPDFFV